MCTSQLCILTSVPFCFWGGGGIATELLCIMFPVKSLNLNVPQNQELSGVADERSRELVFNLVSISILLKDAYSSFYFPRC